jgi:hypothetical protein
MKLLTEEDLENLPRIDDGLDQLLLICIKLSDSELGSELDDEYVESLEMPIIKLLENTDFARYDGHEYGGGYAKIFLYSDDIDRLYKLLYKHLQAFNFTSGSQIILQYSTQDKFVIDPHKPSD